jgi:hypothetical protein
MAGSTERMVRSNPTTFVLKTTLAWFGVNALGDPGRCDAGVVDEHIDARRAHQYVLHCSINRIIAADVEFDHLDPLLAQCLRMFAVLHLRIAHGREHGVAGASQGFSRVTSETGAGASD